MRMNLRIAFVFFLLSAPVAAFAAPVGTGIDPTGDRPYYAAADNAASLPTAYDTSTADTTQNDYVIARIVSLKEEGERIIMDVKDNGRGISEGEIANPKSLGLLGMKERAALLGGEFKIAGARQGNGTRVTVAIPLRHSPPEEKHDENPTNRRSRSRAARVETNSRR